MRALASLAPSLMIALVTILSALPWGLAPDLRFILPLLPYLAIHYWALRYSGRVPAGVVFAAGLALDVLTNGPLGYWALIYLAGHLVALWQSRWSGAGPGVRFLLLLSALVILAVGEWSLASLYYLEVADWKPFALAVAAVGLVSPLSAFVFSQFEPRREQPVRLRLERGS